MIIILLMSGRRSPLSVALQSRQREAEFRAAPDFRFKPDDASMLLDDFAHEGEAQSGRFFVLLVAVAGDAVEFLPYAINRFGRDAVAAIFHHDAHRVRFERRRDGDGRALRAELD